jgi:hypothetical protein
MKEYKKISTIMKKGSAPIWGARQQHKEIFAAIIVESRGFSRQIVIQVAGYDPSPPLETGLSVVMSITVIKAIDWKVDPRLNTPKQTNKQSKVDLL